MSLSERLTIMIMFHTSYAKNFKYFYKSYIEHLHKEDFKNVMSYNRFVELMPRLFMPLNILLHLLFGEEIGIYFMDSTSISVCHNTRRYSNKVFASLVASSKSSMGYFHGFKLHVIINHKGEFVALKITKGNVDDRKPVDEMTKNLIGKIYTDKGYIDQNLFLNLYNRGFKPELGIITLENIIKSDNLPLKKNN